MHNEHTVCVLPIRHQYKILYDDDELMDMTTIPYIIALYVRHLVTPPKLRSTMSVDILSLVAPVLASLTGVWQNTVKTSAMPPLLILGRWEENTVQVFRL